MTYLLRKSSMGRHPTLELTEEEHATLRTAWAAIFSLVRIEETWDCVIQNYLELEQSMLSAALHSSVLRAESYDEVHDLRLGFARRLSNVLTACSAYLDQTPQRLSELGDPAAIKVFDRVRRRVHSLSFGYRLMYGLRNYAQHHGQPLHGTTFDSRWTDGPDEASQLLFSVTATIDVAALRDDPRTEPKLRKELSGDLTHVDAPTMVRTYLEGLGTTHSKVRDHLGESLSAWEASIAEAIARYSALNDGNAFALQLVELAEDGSTVSTSPLFAEMPQRLRRLMRRNGSLINLRRRAVTNGSTMQNHQPRELT